MKNTRIAPTILLSIATIMGCIEAHPEESEIDSPSSEIESDALPIVGGAPADISEWPWIVFLRYSVSTSSCGGSLIAPDWVLTAAHCPTPVDVRVGPVTSTAATRSVTRRITHPGYNAATHENDIALLKLSSPVNNIATISLNRDITFPHEIPLDTAVSTDLANVAIAGWGHTSEGGSGSVDLLAAAAPAITNNTCADAYSAYSVYGRVSASNICAGYRDGGVDTCQNDSGGPLTFSFGGSLLAGVTSWGIGCARPRFPGVYARVSSYIDWILQHVANAKTVSPTALIVVTTAG